MAFISECDSPNALSDMRSINTAAISQSTQILVAAGLELELLLLLEPEAAQFIQRCEVSNSR
ncbi:hypothetical protein ASD86_24190 [Lysobacter sp. Root690]|nr:hypothetical protein ASD86_24190 [Lysobacter sp. Root690]